MLWTEGEEEKEEGEEEREGGKGESMGKASYKVHQGESCYLSRLEVWVVQSFSCCSS